jgi:hypothetical protein
MTSTEFDCLVMIRSLSLVLSTIILAVINTATIVIIVIIIVIVVKEVVLGYLQTLMTP